MTIEVPPKEQIKERTLREVERLRELYLQATSSSLRFKWIDRELWIDKRRLLVVAEAEASLLGASTPDEVAGLSGEKLAFHGCRRCLAGPPDLAEFLAALLVGPEYMPVVPHHIADFINYTVVQPIVNPAFAPLLWLALDVEFSQFEVMSPDMGFAVGAMAFDLSSFPRSRSEATSIREAQIAFLRTRGQDELLQSRNWSGATNEEWAALCQQVLERSEVGNFFWNVHRIALDAVRRAAYLRREAEERARRPKDTFEVLGGGRFACGSYSMVPPSAWSVVLDDRKITIPDADNHHGSLRQFEGIELRPPSDERLVEITEALQSQFLQDDGSAGKAEVVEKEIAGRPALLARMSGRFTSPAAFDRGDIDWPDHLLIRAVFRSPLGWYELTLRGDRSFVEANEAKFMQMLETLAPR